MSVKYSARVDILEISSTDRGGGWGGGGCWKGLGVVGVVFVRKVGWVVSVEGLDRSCLSGGRVGRICPEVVGIYTEV